MTNRLYYGDNLEVSKSASAIQRKSPSLISNASSPPHPIPATWCSIRSVAAGRRNSHGLIETEFGRFPALQIFTLAELFQDRRPKLPPLVSPNRKAPKVETRASHQKGSQGELL